MALDKRGEHCQIDTSFGSKIPNYHRLWNPHYEGCLKYRNKAYTTRYEGDDSVCELQRGELMLPQMITKRVPILRHLMHGNHHRRLSLFTKSSKHMTTRRNRTIRVKGIVVKYSRTFAELDQYVFQERDILERTGKGINTLGYESNWGLVLPKRFCLTRGIDILLGEVYTCPRYKPWRHDDQPGICYDLNRLGKVSLNPPAICGTIALQTEKWIDLSITLGKRCISLFWWNDCRQSTVPQLVEHEAPYKYNA